MRSVWARPPERRGARVSALCEAAASGAGVVVVLWIAGWPSDAAQVALLGFAGAVGGVVLCLAGEYVLRLRRETLRLQGIERQLEVERKQMAQERKPTRAPGRGRSTTGRSQPDLDRGVGRRV
jgi:hypothetical protein